MTEGGWEPPTPPTPASPIALSTLDANVFSLFYDLFVDNLVDPALATRPASKKWISASFPDIPIENASESNSSYIKGHFPWIVIYPLEQSREDASTYTTNNCILETVIDVYSVRAEQMDQIVGQIRSALKTYRSTLTGAGISMKRIRLSTSYRHEKYSGVKLHVKRLRISYDWRYNYV